MISKSDMPQILNPEVIDAISSNPEVFKLLLDSDNIDIDSDTVTIMCDNCRIICSPKLLKFLLCNVKIENGSKAVYTTDEFDSFINDKSCPTCEVLNTNHNKSQKKNTVCVENTLGTENKSLSEIQNLLKHVKENLKELKHLHDELIRKDRQIDKKRKLLSQAKKSTAVLQTKICEKTNTLEIVSNIYDIRLANIYRKEIESLRYTLAYKDKTIQEINFWMEKENENKYNLQIKINEITKKLLLKLTKICTKKTYTL